MEKVLYCGMADDILTPLLLVPDVDIIYAIDLMDSAFAKDGSWSGQKEDILSVMQDGHDKDSHHYSVMKNYEDNPKITELDGTCSILSEETINQIWIVKFTFKGKERELRYHYVRNFYHEWHKEINGIQHLMCMGAEFDYENELTLRKMIKERLNEGFTFYDGSHMREDFDKIFTKSRRNGVGIINSNKLNL